MAYEFPESFPASYADQLNAREGPLLRYIFDLISNQRFAESFSRFFGITKNNIRDEDNLAFISGIVTGALWGDQYFNTDFKQHKPLFGLNCDLLPTEKRHCEKLLTWMFRVLTTTWSQLVSVQVPVNFVEKITDLSIIKTIIEDLRLTHLDEAGLNNCVVKLTNQLTIAFHAVHENPLPILPQAINLPEAINLPQAINLPHAINA